MFLGCQHRLCLPLKGKVVMQIRISRGIPSPKKTSSKQFHTAGLEEVFLVIAAGVNKNTKTHRN